MYGYFAGENNKAEEKKMKKIIAFVLAIALAAVCAVPAFAVSEVDEYEWQILDLINDGVNIGGKTLDISRYYNQAYNYFLKHDTFAEFPGEEQAKVDEIKTAMNSAAADLAAYGIKVQKNNSAAFDVSGANASGEEIRNKMLGYIRPIASEYGITVNYNPTTDILTLKWDGGQLSSEDLIKQTGSESMVVPMVAGAAIVLVVAVCGAFVYTKSRKVKD